MTSKRYKLYVPAVFPKGHRREGQPTMFGTKILNALNHGAGWRKTFILKHGFRGWQYKLDNVNKGYARLCIRVSNEFIIDRFDVFYQKTKIIYNVEKDILTIYVDNKEVDEEKFLSGIGLAREDFISLYLPKRDYKSVIKYNGIMILLTDMMY